ncbi:MAG TPA: tyrosine-type recombinase/integrase [Urbifossiella sp.]|nr:tyrosine-type recombinase/integrase [Urbifossiella sp.]
MARPRNPVPTYSRHPSNNTARCWVGGKWVTLGPWNSTESLEAHRRLCAELAAVGPEVVAAKSSAGAGATVNELLLAFMEHAQTFYRRTDGTPTNEVDEYKQALRFVKNLYGLTPAANFGPLALKAVRTEMVAKGWCRTRVNAQVGRVKRAFRWAASEEIVPGSVVVDLATVAGLKRNRTPAPERKKVGPAPEKLYAATLPHLRPTPLAMVELQRLSGLRPGEVRHLAPRDIDTTGDLWVYAPADHKMSYLGRDKAVPLSRSARALLEVWTTGLGPDDLVFTPARAAAERDAAKRAARMTKVQPSQADRKKPPPTLKTRTPPRFTTMGYAAMIRRACDAAFPLPAALAPRRVGTRKETPPQWWARLIDEEKAAVKAWRLAHRWHPNQLRHSFGTEVREKFGLEVAQTLLGHAKADVTQVYAERVKKAAEEAVRAMG